MPKLQLAAIQPFVDDLHAKYGDANYCPIYGGGCLKSPHLALVFMNPTARNITAQPNWLGLRLPWIGLKQTWKLFYQIGIIDPDFFQETQRLKPDDWTPQFAEALYHNLALHGVYTTNLAKCTQADARPLPDSVFRESRACLFQELRSIKAKHVITFGNQVSSILLEKPISVSRYPDVTHEVLEEGKNQYLIYPCFYPVGHGWMNVGKAIKRIKEIQRLTE